MRDVLRAFTKAASSGLLAVAFGILAMRVLAHSVGTAGIGLFSELREIQRITVLVGTFGGGQAIIQGIAARSGEDKIRFSAEILKIEVVCGILLWLLLAILSPFISQAVFGNHQHWAIFALLGIPVIASIGFSFAITIINGRLFVSTYAVCQAVLALFLWISAIPLSKLAAQGNETAYLWILTIPFLIAGSVGIVILYKKCAFQKFGIFLREKVQWQNISLFMRIAGAMFMTQVLTSAVILILRTGLIHRFGLRVAGDFDPAWTISNVYLNGITGAFNVYFFPKLTAYELNEDRQQLTENMLRLSAIVIGITLVVLLLSRNLVIDHLYGVKFLNATHSMRWMLIGDLFRVTSLFPTVLLIGRGHIKSYIVLEVSMNLIFLLIGTVGYYTKFPLDILGIGYLSAYVIRLVASLSYVRLKREYQLSIQVIVGWLSIFSGLCIATFASWNINQKPINIALVFLSGLIIVAGIIVMLYKKKLIHRALT